MSKTIYQTFHLPKFLKNDWKQLSYGTVTYEFEKQALNLDKQVFCSEVLQLFEQHKGLISFEFLVKKIGEIERPNDNDYEPAILEPIYQFSFQRIIWEDKAHENNSLITLPTFENYISNHSQYKIIYWLLKNAKELSLPCNFSDSEFQFVIDRPFIQILSQQAYGEHYSQFFYQVLEQKLDNDKPCSGKCKI